MHSTSPPSRRVEPVPLVDQLRLTEVGPDEFEGQQPRVDRARLFGGLVVAQALVAAHSTTPGERVPHSAHAYFVAMGDSVAPIRYSVDRIRDGRSYSVRSVRATQGGKTILQLISSFHTDQDTGPRHSALPPVDTLPAGKSPEDVWLETTPPGWQDLHPVDAAPVDVARRPDGRARERRWFRTRGPKARSPLAQACAIAYASDMFMLSTVNADHHEDMWSSRGTMASLDHSLWFHRPDPGADWLLFDAESAIADRGRGFARAEIFDRRGRLVASVAQEGVIRRHG